MLIVLILLSLIFSLASAVPFSRHKHWFIRSFDFPRLQFVFIQLALISVWFAFVIFYSSSKTSIFFSGVLCAMLMLALIVQLFFIYPYLPFSSQVVKSSTLTPRSHSKNALSILVVNVYTPNNRYNDLLTIIQDKKPDIVLTLESDTKWQKGLSSLEENYQYTSFEPLDNLYGMHLYSKLELIDLKVRFIVEDDIPSFHTKVKLRNGELINLHCLHPAPPSPTENVESLERDAELLIVGEEIKQTEASTVVMGDLNDVAWSHTTKLFKKLSGLLDPRVGRGLFNSYNAKHWFLRWPLDHLFHSQDFKCIDIQRLDAFGSDHFPIFIELEHCPSLKDQNTPDDELDTQEKNEIESTIDEADDK